MKIITLYTDNIYIRSASLKKEPRFHWSTTSLRKVFLNRGGQDRERQNRERKIEVYAGNGVFLSRKQAFSKRKKKGLRRVLQKNKKGLRRILERFLVPNMAHDTGLRGGQKSPRGGSCLCGYVRLLA